MRARMTPGSQSFSTAVPVQIACAALVTITPMAENTTIVVGKPSVCPSICARRLWPKRVKSGMFSESVARRFDVSAFRRTARTESRS